MKDTESCLCSWFKQGTS